MTSEDAAVVPVRIREVGGDYDAPWRPSAALQSGEGFADLAERMRVAVRSAKPHEAADDLLVEALKRCALLARPTHPQAADELEDVIGCWQHASMDWSFGVRRGDLPASLLDAGRHDDDGEAGG